MGENKQEILERVLLLMKYDNRQTLSENYRGIISEQPATLKIGQWVPNNDYRIKSREYKDDFVRDTKGDGAYYIPLPPTDEYGEEIAPFNAWDGKIYKDANGKYYIKYDEFISDPKNKIYPFRKSGKSNNYFLTKNGKNLTYSPIETTKGMVNPNSREVKGSELFLDKSGKLKNPNQNLKQFLDFLDNPTQLMVNDYNKNGNQSDYSKIINAWVDYLMSKNLEELLLEYNKLVSFGKGGNTKDLPNYGKGTTTLSSIMLENEIYNRKAQSGKNPPKPEDIVGKPKKWMPKGYFFKTATDLYNSLYESRPNESDGNEFRGWFIKQYPDKAKNPCGDGENLDPEGKYDNKYILCAAEYKPKGSDKTAYQLFKQTKEQKNVTMDAGPKLSDKYSLDSENLGAVNKNCIPFCFLNDDELKVFKSCIGNPSSEEWKYLEQSWYANTVENTDNSKELLSTTIRLKLFSCQPLKISKENAEFLSQKIDNKIYGKLTKMIGTQDVQGQSRRAKEQKIENEAQKQEFYKWVIKQQRVTNIYDNKWLECTIGLKTEDECRETPYCGRRGKEFLEKIARGELKTKEGGTVGNPYRDSSGNVKYYLPDTFDGSSMDNQWDIPCSSDAWDEWGTTIQIGAALAGVIASWIIPPLGGTATLALIAELSIDAAAGAYALYQSVKEKDNIGIAFNSLFLALPFLLELPATDKLFKNIKYGKKGISDLTNKFEQFKNLNPQYTSSQLTTWLNGLTGYELATFKNVIKETETNPYFKQQMKDALTRQADIFKNASLGRRAWIPGTTLSKMLVYVGPMAGYIFGIRNKAIKDNLIRLQNNKQLTVSQVVAWDAALMGLTNDELIELQRRINENPNYFYEQSKEPEYQKVYAIKKELENTKITEEDADRLLDSFDAAIDELVRQQNLDSDSPE